MLSGAGTSENYVSDLEQGRKEVCLRTFERLAEVLEVKLLRLGGGIERNPIALRIPRR